jgi:hypothetical integral membrane protein (TIGR02206 family)
MVAVSVICLLIEVQEYVFMWVFDYQPFFERLPFHLCGALALALPILVLAEQYGAIRFLAGWSIAAGLISLLNLGITHNGPDSLTFYHYFWRHYYLFLLPIFLFISGEFEIKYRQYLNSMTALLGYSAVIFVANWIFGTNYLYIGRNNDMAVPFMPDNLMEWPIIWPSFIVVGVVLFHIIYLGFALAQHRRRRAELRQG